MLSAYIEGGILEPNKEPVQGRPGQIFVSPELAATRLDLALGSEDTKSFMIELGQIIKARGGYTAAARAAGLNRTALYKIVSAGGNPALNTLVALLTPLGLRLSIKPIVEEELQSTSTLPFESEAPRDIYAGDAISREK